MISIAKRQAFPEGQFWIPMLARDGTAPQVERDRHHAALGGAGLIAMPGIKDGIR